MRLLLFSILSLPFLNVYAQFDPAGGEPGSKAVAAQSDLIVGWAPQMKVERGWLNIADTSLGKASFGTVEDAEGAADGQFVSLGDGGFAEIQLASPLRDQMGYEFAVFENGFKYPGGYYLELALVSVSSDGIHFISFPAISLSDTLQQVDNGGTLSPQHLNQLAGKHPIQWGTPFDLADLPNHEWLNPDSIRFIRITDVVGSVDRAYGTPDSRGRLINDPWPTPFPSCGFDLDAVAFLREGYTGIQYLTSRFQIPNPVRCHQSINLPSADVVQAEWILADGRHWSNSIDNHQLETPVLPGMYLLILKTSTSTFSQKICVY